MTKQRCHLSFKNHFELYDNVTSTPIKIASFSGIPKVTIAIPTYKRAALLKEAIESALNQKGHINYDVIIVDNNPIREDETELLINENYFNHPRLSYYKNTENIGMSGNWNRLYQLAKGEWVVMLHDDDMLYDDYLEILFAKIMSKYPNFDAYRPPIQVFSDSSIPKRETTILSYRHVRLHNLYRRNIIDVPSGICMKKEMVLQSGGYNSEFYPASDYEFYVRNINEGYNYMIINGYPLFLYRIFQNDSMNIEVIKGFITQGKNIKDCLLENQSPIIKHLWKQHFQISAMNTIHRAEKIFNKEAITLKKQLNIKPTIYAYFIYYCIQIITRSLETLSTKKINFP